MFMIPGYVFIFANVGDSVYVCAMWLTSHLCGLCFLICPDVRRIEMFVLRHLNVMRICDVSGCKHRMLCVGGFVVFAVATYDFHLFMFGMLEHIKIVCRA